jgi:hypothetical protein
MTRHASVWPFGIALALGLVVVVNAAFAWVATSTRPEIEPSYVRAADQR